MQIAETDRLRLRQFTLEDAPFLLDLLNSPGWLRWIGDRGVKTVEQAQQYITDKMLASYQQWNLGMYLLELKGGGHTAIGACGLVNRPNSNAIGLDDIDLGFALLPDYEGQGFAYEASEAVIADAGTRLGLKRLIAITLPENERSVALLERLGMKKEALVQSGGEQLLRLAMDPIPDRFTGG